MDKLPKAPVGLKASGRALWRSVLTDYELQDHELQLLREAARSADLLDALARVVAVDGLMVASPSGVRAHPALVEARQQKLVLARLLVALRIPIGDQETSTARQAGRSQRRGTRGFYAVGGVA